MNHSLRFVPDFVCQSWAFWVALIVMIIGILLWHNGFLGKKTSEALRPARMNRSDGRSQNPATAGQAPKVYLPVGTASHTNAITGITYSGVGRSGRVHYRSNDANFSLYYEFGGGNCVVWIDIPGANKWERITGLSLSRRDAVLNEIGQQVVKDQVSSGKGYFQIEGNALNIYDRA